MNLKYRNTNVFKIIYNGEDIKILDKHIYNNQTFIINKDDIYSFLASMPEYVRECMTYEETRGEFK